MSERPLKRLLLVATALALPLPGAAAARVECVDASVANRCPAWTMQHDVGGPGGHTSDEATAVAVAPAGDRVFVVGGTSGEAIEILALAPASGQTVWTARVEDARSGLGSYVVLRVAPDGSRLFLLASTPGGDFLIVALDPASGSIVWSTEYDGPSGGWDLARDLAVAPASDQLYVTGSSKEGERTSLVLLALSASTGDRLWTVAYRGPSNYSYARDTGHSVVVSPDGSRVYVAGRSFGNNFDLITLAYDVPEEDEESSSTWAWRRLFTPALNSGLSGRVGLAVSEDGKHVVTSGEGDNDFWTIGYDADGDQLWAAELHGTAASEGWVSTLDETKVEISEGRVFVAISKAWDPGPLLASYALDSGDELWSVRNPTGPPLDESSMVVSPDGDTLYTLASSLDAGYGASVAAWDADTGIPQWMGRMLSPREGIYGNALAISPSGDALYAAGGTSPYERGFAEVMGRTADFLTWSYEL